VNVEVGTSGYTNIAIPEAAQSRTWLSVLLLFIFAALYVLLLPGAEYPEVVWLTLIPTTLALWLGPLGLISQRGDRTWYDPATLFNIAVLYYSLKGASLALGHHPDYLRFVPDPTIVGCYRLVVLCVTTGIVAWWFGYRVMSGFIQRRHALSGLDGAVSTRPCRDTDTGALHMSVLLLSLLGLFGGVMFFRSVGVGVTAFITNPVQRCYLTDGTMGISAPLANIWKESMMMFPVATTLWLVGIGSQGRNPGLAWWLHAAASMFIHLAMSGRGETIGFILSIVFIYHLTVKRLSWGSLALLCVVGLTYAYVVRTWRSVAGAVGPQEAGGSELMSAISMTGFRSFLESTDLADIRLFVLIADVYGNSMPLKYGSSFLRVFSQLVPRFLWPTKPPDLGVEISNLYGGVSLAGTPAGFFAEMYMNFGALGVAVGSALLGAGLALLYQKWIAWDRRPAHVALYAICIPAILLLPSMTVANAILALGVLMTGMILALRLAGVK
jgi:hypothetical protein